MCTSVYLLERVRLETEEVFFSNVATETYDIFLDESARKRRQYEQEQQKIQKEIAQNQAVTAKFSQVCRCTDLLVIP